MGVLFGLLVGGGFIGSYGGGGDYSVGALLGGIFVWGVFEGLSVFELFPEEV